ncbi:MAG: AmmeMemoRadiSam system protein A [Acidobacteriota bacterium]
MGLVEDEESLERPRLTDDQQRLLLRIARQSLETYFRDGKMLTPEVDDPELAKPRAAFVSLTRAGQLRGCIGFSEPRYPLHQTVAQCSVAAATQDHRFASVALWEVPELEISISVLSPLRKLETFARLRPGKHGLLVASQGRRGLLLPQVAIEFGWDRETFLSQTCRKAGLPAETWKEEQAEVFVFEAVVFSEEEKGKSASLPSA